MRIQSDQTLWWNFELTCKNWCLYIEILPLIIHISKDLLQEFVYATLSIAIGH